MENKKTQYVGSIERESVTVTILLLLAASLLLTTSCSSTSKVAASSTKTSKTVSHKYVDLGLPSKTLWATCNVGAKKAEEYGNFYAWGETKPKNDYSWSTYTLSCDSITKDIQVVSNNREDTRKETCHYLTDRYTSSDVIINVLPQDDAATVNWGKEWKTPTLEQWNELSDTTLCQWTQQKKGFLVTSKKNGKSIFLPACGFYYGKKAPETFLNEGDSIRYEGCYWAGTISGKGKAENYASNLRFNTGYQRMKLPYISMIPDLYCGMSIRPVTKLQE